MVVTCCVPQAEAAAAGIDLSEDDKSVLMMKCIHRGLAGPIIACCFKIRECVGCPLSSRLLLQ
jgi:hypothetical protein